MQLAHKQQTHTDPQRNHISFFIHEKTFSIARNVRRRAKRHWVTNESRTGMDGKSGRQIGNSTEQKTPPSPSNFLPSAPLELPTFGVHCVIVLSRSVSVTHPYSPCMRLRRLRAKEVRWRSNLKAVAPYTIHTYVCTLYIHTYICCRWMKV